MSDFFQQAASILNANNYQGDYYTRILNALRDLAAGGGGGGTGGTARDVQLRNNGTSIQWKYSDEPASAWRNLFALEDVKGEDGRAVELEVNENGELIWRYSGDTDWIVLPVKMLLQGGEKGQVLTKVSDNDYDVKWEAAQKVYTHEQNTASDVWLIQHNFIKFPLTPVLLDEQGDMILGYMDLPASTVNLSVVRFHEPLTGKAYVFN